MLCDSQFLKRKDRKGCKKLEGPKSEKSKVLTPQSNTANDKEPLNTSNSKASSANDNASAAGNSSSAFGDSNINILTSSTSTQPTGEFSTQ